MLEKSPEAFKTISEAADELGVEQHVLRFWETKFTQIKPLKRRGGRRYYRPEDMEVLYRVRHLLYKQGFTIKGAKKAMQAKEPAEETAVAMAEAQEVASTLESESKQAKSAQSAPARQLDLLSPVAKGIGATERKALEKLLTTLQSARKDLQSAA